MTIASVIDTSVNSSARPKKKQNLKKIRQKERVNLTLNPVLTCVWDRDHPEYFVANITNYSLWPSDKGRQ